MLDFTEVGRRIIQRNNCECGHLHPEITHEEIISPLIGQLFDPEYHGENGVLLAPHECVNLGTTLQRQAQILDDKERLLADVEQTIDDTDEVLRKAAASVRQLMICCAALALVVVLEAGVIIGRLL